MVNPKTLTNADGEVRELTEEDLQTGVSFSELPKNLYERWIRHFDCVPVTGDGCGHELRG